MKNFIQIFATLLAFFAIQQKTIAQCEVTSVNTTDGEHTAYTCTQDGNADMVPFFNSNTSGSNYAYAITDNNYNILAIETNDSHDFDGAPPGTCFVWGFSYTGNLIAQTGGSVFSVQFSDECWLISKNAIRIVRDAPDGGTVSTPQGATSFYACLNDGISDVIGFANNSTSNSNYAYVITDDQNNILAIPHVAYQDFSGAGPGVCRVWGLSYTGNLLAAPGMNAAAAELADNCFDLSDNFIEVVRNEVDGGQVTMPNGNTHRSICSGDGNADVVMFVNTSSTSANYVYAITNENNEILMITSDSQFDFDVAPSGVCRIWGFSYTGDILAEPGESVFTTRFSAGCWEISSTAITVNRTGVDGGEVMTTSGETIIYTCPGDGVSDAISFDVSTNEPGASSQIVVTDPNLNILGLPPGNTVDFEGAGVGECWVWSLSYTGTLQLEMGDNVTDVDALSDGCFHLSDNFVVVNRDEPEGGTVETTNGENNVNVIAGDGIDDVIEFVSNGTSNSNFTYVITDDQNNILGIPPGNSQNFEGAGAGVCRVWGLSYTGSITAAAGDNAATTDLTDGCFDLSDNFIEVIRMDPAPNPIVDNGGIKISLSPNPTPNVVYVEMELEVEPADNSTIISVFHISGQLMHAEKISAQTGNNNYQIDLGDLEEGFYKMTVQNGRAFTQTNFVKQ